MVNNNSDKGYFTRSIFFRSVFASPLAGIGLALAEIGDSIIVGHGIGMNAIAAIGYLSPLFLLFSFLSFGLSTGGAIIYNDLMNEGKRDEALDIFNTFILVSGVICVILLLFIFMMQDNLLLLLGVEPEDREVYAMAKSYLFFIVLGGPFEIISEVLNAYLRNDKDVTFSLVVQTICGISNLIISAVLLFIFDWGIAGCSFGFFASNLATAAVTFIYILRSNNELKFRTRFVSLKQIIKPLRLGFATSAEYIFGAVLSLTFIHIMSGLSGAEGVAVYNIIQDISVVFVFIFEMIGKTAQPIFTTYNSEHNKSELRRMFKYCVVYSVLIGVMFIVVIFCYPQILTLFFGMEDAKDLSAVYRAAYIFGFGAIFMGISLLMQNFTQSVGDDKGVFAFVFMRQLGVAIPVLLLLSLWGSDAVWFVYPLTEIISQIIYFVIWRIRKNKSVDSDKTVYCTSFSVDNTNIFKELDSIEMFFSQRGIDKKRCIRLRFSLEEIFGAIEEYAGKKEHILAQLTIIKDSDGSVEVHLRSNSKEFNMFSSLPERLTTIPEKDSEVDIRGLALLVVRNNSKNRLYRNHQGFDTLTYRI